MVAQFKSNVRLREEKGFGSVSMKRLIFCGVGAVLVFMLVRFTALAGFSLPILAGVFIALLVLSGSRGGLPLWQRMWLGWRGAVILRAIRHPQNPVAQIAALLQLDVSVARVHSRRVFGVHTPERTADPGDWTLYASLMEAEGQEGLRFVALQEGERPDGQSSEAAGG